MQNLSKLILIIFIITLSNSCYLRKVRRVTSYKWRTEKEYYNNGLIKEITKDKVLRRYSRGTSNRFGAIHINKKYDINRKLTSKQIILHEGGGCIAFIFNNDTVKNRFPKLYLRRFKYMLGL